MRQRYLSLSILIISSCLIKSLLSVTTSTYESVNLSGPFNSEALLAMKIKIPIRTASIADLILIKKLSDNLAQRIISLRIEILDKATKLPLGNKHRALEMVKGIGKKNAVYFNRYLDLT